MLEEAILDLTAVSPDGRWIAVLQTDEANKDHPYRTLAYPNGGGKPVRLCAFCFVWWSVDGKYLAFRFPQTVNSAGQTYLLPVISEHGLPALPPEGFGGAEDLNKSGRVTAVPREADSVLAPNDYSYTMTNTRRNIYRIPIS